MEKTLEVRKGKNYCDDMTRQKQPLKKYANIENETYTLLNKETRSCGCDFAISPI